jgi:hypothetical protein
MGPEEKPFVTTPRPKTNFSRVMLKKITTEAESRGRGRGVSSPRVAVLSVAHPPLQTPGVLLRKGSPQTTPARSILRCTIEHE